MGIILLYYAEAHGVLLIICNNIAIFFIENCYLSYVNTVKNSEGYIYV